MHNLFILEQPHKNKLAGGIHGLREIMLMDPIQVILEEQTTEDSEDCVFILTGKFYPVKSNDFPSLECLT